MTLAPLMQAGPAILTHAVAALLAIVVGAAQLCLPKGTVVHKVSGYIWATLMLWTATTSLFIHTIRLFGPFSPIHLLSLIPLVAMPRAILAARSGNIARHETIMRALYAWSLIVAGLFTFLPGRIMHQVLFGS